MRNNISIYLHSLLSMGLVKIIYFWLQQKVLALSGLHQHCQQRATITGPSLYAKTYPTLPALGCKSIYFIMYFCKEDLVSSRLRLIILTFQQHMLEYIFETYQNLFQASFFFLCIHYTYIHIATSPLL